MKQKGLKPNTMATYRIKIQGSLGEEWSVRFYGLSINVEASDDDQMPVSVLSGQLPNQDALRQVLNALYDQRFPILSLEYLEEDSESWQQLNDEDSVSDSS